MGEASDFACLASKETQMLEFSREKINLILEVL